MNIKALIFDLDETLVKLGDNRIEPNIVDAIKTIRKTGVLTYIASGRAPYFINDNLIKEIGAEAIICCNGACAIDPYRNYLYYDSIDLTKANNLLDFIRKNNYAIGFKGKEYFKIYHNYIYFLNNYPHIKENEKYLINAEKETIKEDVNDAFIFGDHEIIIDYLKKIKLNYAIVRDNAIECFNIGNNKAIALNLILKYKNLSLRDCLAFGDSMNDIEMLQNAKIGIAVGNANDAVKEIADYITGDYNQNGIINALKHYQLLS